MEWSSGDSGSDYFDCVTDRSSGSSSEETEYQLRPNVVMEEILSGASTRDPDGKAVKNETQRTQTIRKFRRIDTNRKKTDITDKHETPARGSTSELERNQEQQRGDVVEIHGYELRAPPNSHALNRLSLDAVVQPKESEKSQLMRSKVPFVDEVLKILFGPADAKTPDEEKYELVEEEEVNHGVRRTGILFRFSMWATIGFVAWVLGGRRAQIGCSEFFPNVHERDPVPKVIVRRQR